MVVGLPERSYGALFEGAAGGRRDSGLTGGDVGEPKGGEGRVDGLCPDGSRPLWMGRF